MKNLVFDIMVGDRFYRTMHMPVTIDMIKEYNGDEPVYDADKIEEWVIRKCPTLKYDNFKICF